MPKIGTIAIVLVLATSAVGQDHWANVTGTLTGPYAASESGQSATSPLCLTPSGRSASEVEQKCPKGFDPVPNQPKLCWTHIKVPAPPDVPAVMGMRPMTASCSPIPCDPPMPTDSPMGCLRYTEYPTCTDKTRILMHDEQEPPQWWCHKPEVGR